MTGTQNNIQNGGSLEDFIKATLEDEEATGARVYIEYPLEQNLTTRGLYSYVAPRIVCQCLEKGGGEVFGQYTEKFPRYVPSETKINPEKIRGLSEKIRIRAKGMAEKIYRAGINGGKDLKVALYLQGAPSCDVLQQERHQTK